MKNNTHHIVKNRDIIWSENGDKRGDIATLWQQTNTGSSAYLLRYMSTNKILLKPHSGQVVVYIAEGDISINNQVLNTGDYVIILKYDELKTTIVTKEGCKLFIYNKPS